MRAPNEFFTRLEENSQDLTHLGGRAVFRAAPRHLYHPGQQQEIQPPERVHAARCRVPLGRGACLPAATHIRSAELDRLWKTGAHQPVPRYHPRLVDQPGLPGFQPRITRMCWAAAPALRNQAAGCAAWANRPRKASRSARSTPPASTALRWSSCPTAPRGVQTSADGKPLGRRQRARLWLLRSSSPNADTAQQVSVTEKDGTHRAGKRIRTGRTDHRWQPGQPVRQARAARKHRSRARPANHFVLYDDQPNNWDAWDVDVFHLEKRERGQPARNPARWSSTARCAPRLPLNTSSARTAPSPRPYPLTAISPRLDFNTEVEWHERHKFLKVEFPLNVRAMNATYEVQFGHLAAPHPLQHQLGYGAL